MTQTVPGTAPDRIGAVPPGEVASRPPRESRRVPPLIVVAAVTVAALTLIPLASVVASTVSIGWSEASRLLLRPRVGELLGNTVGLTVTVVLTCGAVGTAAAWLVVRTTLPGRRVWAALLAAPLAVPAFVNSYGWASLTPAVEGFAGAVLITTLSYYPLVFLPVAAVLRGLDPALEESARALGLGPWAAFRRVVLPQLRPALLGGGLLVGLHLLAEFGALQMLRFPTFTTAIYDQFQSTFNGPAATMLAGRAGRALPAPVGLGAGAVGARRATRGSDPVPPGAPCRTGWAATCRSRCSGWPRWSGSHSAYRWAVCGTG